MPRYLQVRDWLAERIESGAVAKGTKLPAEKDWAPALGISQMTLNHAIQALVKDGLIVREVGRGTFVADSERTVTPTHIGLVLHWRKDSDGGHYGTHMLQGIYQTAANRPVRLSFVWGSHFDDEPADHYVRLAAEMNADGLLLVIPPAHALINVLTLQEAGIPFVVVGASWDSYQLPCVDFDNAAGTEQAVRHLMALGHERIGLINGAMYLRSSLIRTRTFHHVLEENGLAFDPAWEVTSPSFTMDAHAAQNLKALLHSSQAPTAYFAAGYYLSMQTTEMVQSLGWKIPEDISVVGFGDPFTAAYLSPPLTTVRHPIETLGELAATRLLDDVANSRLSSDTDLLPVEFVERRSTAPLLPNGTAGHPHAGGETARG
jgi:DNA-binding LacI/PurR family transcriptional regulator